MFPQNPTWWPSMSPIYSYKRSFVSLTPKAPTSLDPLANHTTHTLASFDFFAPFPSVLVCL